MKYLFILILSMMTASPILADPERSPASIDTLINSRWSGSANPGALWLKFDNKFVEITFNFEGRTCGKYGYKLKDGVVYIESSPSACNPDEGINLMFENVICRFNRDSADLLFRQYLLCSGNGNYRINRKESEIKKGEPIKIGPYECISEGNWYGHTTANVRFRSKPDIKGTPITVSISRGIYDEPFPPSSVIPKETQVWILGKTKDKFKVQQWNNHWFYIRVSDAKRGDVTGWIYGEFIKISDRPAGY